MSSFRHLGGDVDPSFTGNSETNSLRIPFRQRTNTIEASAKHFRQAPALLQSIFQWVTRIICMVWLGGVANQLVRRDWPGNWVV